MIHFLSSSFANFQNHWNQLILTRAMLQNKNMRQFYSAASLSQGCSPAGCISTWETVFLNILVYNTWNIQSPIKISDKRTRALLWHQTNCADEELPHKKQNEHNSSAIPVQKLCSWRRGWAGTRVGHGPNLCTLDLLGSFEVWIWAEAHNKQELWLFSEFI